MGWWDLFVWGYATGQDDIEDDNREEVDIEITINMGEENGSK